MPNYDRLHRAVVEALEKAGWLIGEQVWFSFDYRKIWLDIQAFQGNTRIFVEVKGFENMRSEVEYLTNVLGQYLLYRASLNHHLIAAPLYLAVPREAMRGILSEAIGRLVIKTGDIKLLVFDGERAEIIEWIA